MDGREIGQIIVHWNKVNRAFREGSAALIIGILAAVFGTFFLWLGLVQAIGAALIAFGVVVWGYRLLLIFRKKASNKRLSFAYNVYWLKGDDGSVERKPYCPFCYELDGKLVHLSVWDGHDLAPQRPSPFPLAKCHECKRGEIQIATGALFTNIDLRKLS